MDVTDSLICAVSIAAFSTVYIVSRKGTAGDDKALEILGGYLYYFPLRIIEHAVFKNNCLAAGVSVYKRCIAVAVCGFFKSNIFECNICGRCYGRTGDNGAVCADKRNVFIHRNTGSEFIIAAYEYRAAVTDAFHGEARVESTQGVGSSFIVAFRREETDEAPDAGGNSLTAPDGADG